MIEETSELVAVIPMKPLSRSKTRLAPHMSEEQRSDLVVGMLHRVLGAIKGSSIEMFWVVGGDERIRNVARNFDGIWMEELGRNLNDTLGKAFDELAGRNAAALYLAGDLPFLKPSDLHSLLRSSRRNTNITLAPARRDGGTNAILVPPGIPFRPELGPRSFSKHLSTAAAMEVSVALCYSPGLGFDLDITDDLETFQHMEPGLIDRLSCRGPSGEQ